MIYEIVYYKQNGEPVTPTKARGTPEPGSTQEYADLINKTRLPQMEWWQVGRFDYTKKRRTK